MTRRIRLPGCDGVHSVYLAPAGRAFVACEHNARLAIVNRTRGRLVDLARVGTDPDVLAVDPTDARLYVAAESGTLTVVATRPAARASARAHLADTAHTVAVDPSTRRVFVPLEPLADTQYCGSSSLPAEAILSRALFHWRPTGPR